MEKLTLTIQGVTLVSTNEAYRPTYKGKRSFYRKSTELIAFQEDFSSKLEAFRDTANLFTEQLSSCEHLGLKLTIVIEMPRNMFFYKRKSDDLRPNDTSNFIKAIEDQISKFVGIDDKYNVKVTAVKCFSDEIELSNVYAILEPDDYMAYSSDKILEFYGLEDIHDKV